MRGVLIQAATVAVASAAAVRTLRSQSGQGGKQADLNQVLQPEILRGTGLQWLQDEEGKRGELSKLAEDDAFWDEAAEACE